MATLVTWAERLADRARVSYQRREAAVQFEMDLLELGAWPAVAWFMLGNESPDDLIADWPGDDRPGPARSA